MLVAAIQAAHLIIHAVNSIDGFDLTSCEESTVKNYVVFGIFSSLVLITKHTNSIHAFGEI